MVVVATGAAARPALLPRLPAAAAMEEAAAAMEAVAAAMEAAAAAMEAVEVDTVVAAVAVVSVVLG